MLKFLNPYTMRTRQLFCFLTAALALLLFSFASHGEGRPFITRWKGEKGKELRIPINANYYNDYRLIIKRASDGSVLVTKNDCCYTYSYIPTEDGELLVEAGPEGVSSIRMNGGSAEALLRVEQFGTVEWQTMENAFRGCTNLQFSAGIDTPDLSQVTNMSDMFKSCTSFNQELGMWKLERCRELGLDNCGMSVENYSKSLEGWAAQTNIERGLQLNAEGLKYNASAKAARKQLREGKGWRIRGDADENDRPFITRWKGEARKELRIPIYGNNYKLIIKRASDGSVLVTENGWYDTSYSYIPTEDGELLVEAGPEGVSSIRMNGGSAEALLRVEQFGTVQWQTMWYAFSGCKNLQFAAGIDVPDLSKVTNMSGMFSRCISFNHPLNNWNVSKVTDMNCMFSDCTSFNQDLGMWKLERCQELGLDNCGMSVENYSKSLVGWAAQTNIKRGLQLNAEGLKYNASGKAARKQLIEGKNWRIRDDFDANGRPFITRWKGEAGKELRIPIYGRYYKLVIKKASDNTILKTESSLTIDGNNWDNRAYKFTPTEDGELLVEAGPEGVSSIRMNEW